MKHTPRRAGKNHDVVMQFLAHCALGAKALYWGPVYVAMSTKLWEEKETNYAALKKSHANMLQTLKNFAENECEYCVGDEDVDDTWAHDKGCPLMAEIKQAESLEVK